MNIKPKSSTLQINQKGILNSHLLGSLFLSHRPLPIRIKVVSPLITRGFSGGISRCGSIHGPSCFSTNIIKQRRWRWRWWASTVRESISLPDYPFPLSLSLPLPRFPFYIPFPVSFSPLPLPLPFPLSLPVVHETRPSITNESQVSANSVTPSKPMRRRTSISFS